MAPAMLAVVLALGLCAGSFSFALAQSPPSRLVLLCKMRVGDQPLGDMNLTIDFAAKEVNGFRRQSAREPCRGPLRRRTVHSMSPP